MRLRRIICLMTLAALLAALAPQAGLPAKAAAKYYITVDVTNQIVTVYDNGNTTESGIARQMICSTGKSSTPTPTGTYTLPSKWRSTERTEWYYFPEYSCYAKWATRIVGGILFHSVLYSAAKKGPTRSSTNALGSKASHGCVRLRVADAKWIAQNCPAGTKCRVYNSGKTNSALRKKLLKKSFSRASETYEQYMGGETGETSSAPLARGSKGQRVRDLQSRLKALGYLAGSVDGKFGTETETAVKRFQAACGLSKTGKVNDALWTRLQADDAPTGSWVTLSKGMSGPAVAALQRALIALKLYEGAADGSFTAATVGAVKRFQACYGYVQNGKAAQALQKDALDRAAALAAQYGAGEYRLVTADVEVSMGRLKSAQTLRAKASAKGKSLGKLKAGTEVEVLSRGKTWSKVLYNLQTGYLKNTTLTAFTGARETLSYEPVPTPTPEVFIPTPSPSPEVPETTPAPEATGEAPGVTPSPTPEVFIPTPSPTPPADLTSPEPANGWDFVNPEPTNGWEITLLAVPAEEEPEPDAAPAEEQPAPTAAPAEGDVPAVNVNLSDGETRLPRYAVTLREGAPLFALPDAQAPLLAELPAETALEALEAGADWVTVLWNGAPAYVPAADARLTDELPAPAPEIAAPAIEPGAEQAPEPQDSGLEVWENGLMVEIEEVRE